MDLALAYSKNTVLQKSKQQRQSTSESFGLSIMSLWWVRPEDIYITGNVLP